MAPATPVLLGEMAVGPQTNRQAADVRALFRAITANHPIGLIWFDRNQGYRRSAYHQDWRLEDYPGTLAAFRAALAGLTQLRSLPGS